MAADLEQRDAVARIRGQLLLLDLEPEIVVNNAGFGLVGPAAKLLRDEQLGMIDLNVRALTELSLSFVDSLARHRGGILNVASIAAFLPGPHMAVYYASKAFVLSFSEALHRELSSRGIRVTALCPGPVPTEFQARSGMRMSRSMNPITLPPDRVAQIGYRGFMRGKRVVIAGLGNKVVVFLLRLIPNALLLRVVDMRTARDSSWPRHGFFNFGYDHDRHCTYVFEHPVMQQSILIISCTRSTPHRVALATPCGSSVTHSTSAGRASAIRCRRPWPTMPPASSSVAR